MNSISTACALLSLSNAYFTEGQQVRPSNDANYQFSGVEFRKEIYQNLLEATQKAKIIKSTDDLVKVEIRTKSGDGYTIDNRIFISGGLKFVDNKQDPKTKVACYRFLINQARGESFPSTPIELLVLINNQKDMDAMKTVMPYIPSYKDNSTVQGNNSFVFGIAGDVLPPTLSKELKFPQLSSETNRSCTVVTDFGSLTLRLEKEGSGSRG